jgi:hypothetical protein
MGWFRKSPTESFVRATLFASLAVSAWSGASGQNDQAAPPVYLGVLEDIQAQDTELISSKRHVRIAFAKQGATWRPMDTNFRSQQALAGAITHYPAAITWTVVFNGRSLGSITSRNPEGLLGYGDIGTHIITTKEAGIPRITTGASEFQYALGKARTRPLLLISAPRFRDPDAWKPAVLTPAEKRLAVVAFRKKIPTLDQCDEPEQEPVHLIPYADEEVLLLKAYRDKNGRIVLGERLDNSKSNCGFFDDEHFYSYWFAIANGEVRYLDSQMTPLEAADIDEVGKSSWIFLTSRGEDQDGYELFDSEFQERAQFHWSYH